MNQNHKQVLLLLNFTHIKVFLVSNVATLLLHCLLSCLWDQKICHNPQASLVPEYLLGKPSLCHPRFLVLLVYFYTVINNKGWLVKSSQAKYPN